MAGAPRWTRVENCANPVTPRDSPMLLRFYGKWTVDTVMADPNNGRRVVITKALLKQMIDEDLSNDLPVLLEVRAQLRQMLTLLDKGDRKGR